MLRGRQPAPDIYIEASLYCMAHTEDHGEPAFAAALSCAWWLINYAAGF